MSKSLQRRVADWCSATFHHRLNRAHDALAVAEEAGEVARAVLKYDQALQGVDRKKLGPAYWHEQVELEAADTLIALLSLAANHGFDLLEATEARLVTVMERTGYRTEASQATGHMAE